MSKQCRQVLSYMIEHLTITQRDALKFGCYRLASRISDLRRMGYQISTRRREVVKSDGTRTHIAEYTLTLRRPI